MIKKLVLVFIAIFAINSYGQEGTASPYSFYGIGSLRFKGTVENRSMGGLSIYSDSIHINLRNPAGYGGNNLEVLNGESRPVKFTVGGTYTDVKLKTDSESAKASSTTFDYLAMSIPIGKFGLGFGLLPYTAVGYKLESLDDRFNDKEKQSTRFNGEGGLNKVFLGFGYQITDELSAGIDAHYNFGNIQNSSIKFTYDDDGVETQYQTSENNRSDLSGLSINLGLSYKTMLSKNLELVSGLTYSPKSKLASKNQRFISALIISDSGNQTVFNTVETDLESLGLSETDLVLPSKFSIGTGIGKPRKWFVGVESEYQKSSDFSNNLYTGKTIKYENTSTLSIGGFYIPQYNSFTNYFKRAVYRAGIHYENTGLNIENESINEFGISFGVGLPVGSFFSNANLGLEFGKRGTTKSNLIQENFINFQISLSLNDRWFQKRKYD